jgi:hypothetical protein
MWRAHFTQRALFSGLATMKKPTVALSTMVTFTLSVMAVGICLVSGLGRAFASNPWLNALILCILTVGVGAAFRQVFRVYQAISWVNNFKRASLPLSSVPPVLVPLSPALQGYGRPTSVSPAALRAMLEGVFNRVDESREISRYLMNTLILLGLLGTFWGLLETVAGIGSVMSGLNVGDGDLKSVFDNFKQGLKTPLEGMGVSFSASLFGLGSSLILGFLDLNAGRAQSRFCEELEEWIGGSASAENKESVIEPVALPVNVAPARYQEALVQNLAEQLDRMHKTFKMQEEARSSERASMFSLAERAAAIDDHLKAQQHVLNKLTDIQQQVSPVLARLADRLSATNQETIEEHTRRIDLNLKDIGDKVSRSAESLASELRDELKIIAKLLASSEANNNA